MRASFLPLFGALATVGACGAEFMSGPSSGPEQNDSASPYVWTGTLVSGATLAIADVNGSVTVVPSTGDNVEVTAVKRWRGSIPDDVHIEVRRYGSAGENVAVCALWTTTSSCSEGQTSRAENTGKSSDVVVDFTVRLPSDRRLVATTVNGNIDIDAPTGAVVATAVNGKIEIVHARGPVVATTVNGNITLEASGPLAGDVFLTAVNGSLIATLPGDASADVQLTTVNGTASTNFLSVTSSVGGRTLTTHIGSPGGPAVRLATVNGNATLNRR
jgi:hypothetical protein